MAIANYTDLQSAVADYLARADLTARIPDFVTLAESHFNRDLRTREMMTFATIALTSGAAAAPADMVEWVSAGWVGTRSRDLKYCEMDSEQWRFRYRPNGDPSMFTILGSVISIRPIAAGSVNFVYYAAIPALAINATNWLLTKCPDLYLYRSLAEAYIYQKNDARAAEFLGLADAQVQKAAESADTNKAGRRPNAQPPGDDTGTA